MTACRLLSTITNYKYINHNHNQRQTIFLALFSSSNLFMLLFPIKTSFIIDSITYAFHYYSNLFLYSIFIHNVIIRVTNYVYNTFNIVQYFTVC